MTSVEEGQPPSNDPEEWQDTHTAKLHSNSAKVQHCNITTMEQYNSNIATVQQYVNATVQQYVSASVQQYNSSTVQQYNRTTVH